MRISIRMIGLATTLFWVFLIAFSITAVYSVKDLHFDFGDPQMSMTADNKVVFSLPISIVNRGFYNIGFFNITTEISDEEGLVLARGLTFTPVIKRNNKVIINHNVTIDVYDLLQNHQDYLFSDGELRMCASASMRLAELIPVQASTNLSMPWGAPLYNFLLGELNYTAFNITHFRALVPVSFENHAFFDVVGNIQLRIFNSTSVLLGDGETVIEVSQGALYNGFVELYVPIAEMTESGYFEASFLTPLFDYGPLVIPFG